MTGYFKLEAKIDNEKELAGIVFDVENLNDIDILALATLLHYKVIEEVVRPLRLNEEAASNKIGQMIMRSRDALLELYISNTKKEEKEHGNVIRLDRRI